MSVLHCWLGMKGPGALFLIVGFFLLFSNQAAAVIVNRTIDDTFGDSETGLLPIFLPSTTGVWKDQRCSDCAIRPDTSRAFQKTYTSTTYNPALGSTNITMDFNGTAIYIFFILANNAGDGITSITNCVFKLDGQRVGTFEHSPDLTKTDIEYNVLAFSKTDIPFGRHHFVIATEGINFNAYINFDYAIYTHDDDPVSPTTLSSSDKPTGATNSASSSPPTQSSNSAPSPDNAVNTRSNGGAIAGGVIGGLIFLAIVAIVLWFYVCRPRRHFKRRVLLISDDEIDQNAFSSHRRMNSSKELPFPIAQRDTITTFAATGTPYGGGTPSQAPTATRSQSEATLTSGEPETTITAVTQPSSLTLSPDQSIPRPPMHITNPDPVARKRISITRQADLRKKLTSMKEEINDLKADLKLRAVAAPAGDIPDLPSETPSPGSSPGSKSRQTATVAQLKEQIRVLMEQVSNLQSQQFSPWAMGLSNEPPPGYSPASASSPGVPFVPDQKENS